MNKKKIILSISALIVLSAGVSFTYLHQNSALAKCPDDYATGEEQTAATNKWTSDFFDAHPDASMTDWANARHQFYVDNQCTAALQRYEDAKAGKADPEKMKMVDGILRDAIPVLHYESPLGFSFDYPSDMFVMADPDAPRIYVIPNSYKTNHDNPMTAVVISAMVNDDSLTPLEWLKGPNSGADMAMGYRTLELDGQEAVAMNGQDWVVVNTPDKKRQLSIATLPSATLDSQIQASMESVVNSLIFGR